MGVGTTANDIARRSEFDWTQTPYCAAGVPVNVYNQPAEPTGQYVRKASGCRRVLISPVEETGGCKRDPWYGYEVDRDLGGKIAL